MAVRKESSSPFEKNFSIVKVLDNISKQDTIYSEVSDKLSDFKNDNVQRTMQRTSESDSVKGTMDKWPEDNDKNIQVVDKSAESQDFFQDDNALGKRYTTTRIKPRNFLSNIAYVRINKKDYYNEKFYFDIFLLVTKNLNPFSLDRKLADKSKHEMIYMLWKECMPQKFYRHVCKEKNFFYLNGKNVLQP